MYRITDDDINVDISALNQLQGKIIEITNVNPIGYNNNYIKQKLETKEIKIKLKKKFQKRVDFNMLLQSKEKR